MPVASASNDMVLLLELLLAQECFLLQIVYRVSWVVLYLLGCIEINIYDSNDLLPADIFVWPLKEEIKKKQSHEVNQK